MMLRLLAPLATVVAAGFPLVVAEPAPAGGTAVVAPEELGPDDCEQGVHPRILGFRKEVAPKVIGCVLLSDGDEVLVAVDSHGRGACFYAALAGEQHVDGPCIGLRPGTPWTRGGGVETLSVLKPEGDSGAYVGGVVPRGTAHAFVRYRTRDSGTREWPATSIRVHERLAGQVGARRPFSYFVGEIPRDADTCRRLLVEGRDHDAELVASDRLNESTVSTDEISLPGSKECEAGRATGRGVGVADALGGVGTAIDATN
jgi:hypothetical protein